MSPSCSASPAGVTFAKLVRGEVLRIREYSFIEAADSIGCSRPRILVRHILPQTFGLILVNATLTMGQMIISEATLSFLGLGVPAPTPTLGGILADAQQTFFAAWWIVVFPGGRAHADHTRDQHRRGPSARLLRAPGVGLPMSTAEAGALLSVRNLRTVIDTPHGSFPVVDDVSFELHSGHVLGIVGESGSGKTLLSMSILGLLPKNARIDAGTVLLGGRDLRGLSERELRGVRGRRIGMIFQEPQTSFDPLYTVGDQIEESIRRHSSRGRRQARARAVELLDTVGIPRPDLVFGQYPFQLSGGLRQRAMIAMALAPGPELLIADEPTTALDVTIQAQILELLKGLQRETGIAVLFISHHLGVIAEVADEVMVMYGGQLMEHASVERLFDEPAHPYTRSLLDARPTLSGVPSRLRAIPGQVPSLESRPSGCPFHPRCDKALEICARERPTWRHIGENRHVACWLHAAGGAR